jgi:hypothetical protein
MLLICQLATAPQLITKGGCFGRSFSLDATAGGQIDVSLAYLPNLVHGKPYQHLYSAHRGVSRSVKESHSGGRLVTLGREQTPP